MTAAKVSRVAPPSAFSIARETPVGRHRLVDIFRGLEETSPFQQYPASAAVRQRVVRGAAVEVVPGRVWMYVAPHEVPPFAKTVGWEPVTSKADCIVVGRRHLTRSRVLTVYLDILHELFHVFQRREGRDLWDLSKGYAGSPTELEAYEFALGEARRLGATDAYLRSYLDLEWMDRKEYARLLRNLGVPAG